MAAFGTLMLLKIASSAVRYRRWALSFACALSQAGTVAKRSSSSRAGGPSCGRTASAGTFALKMATL
eukprot:11209751-Lingulodinium_polyedra.AAC.1